MRTWILALALVFGVVSAPAYAQNKVPIVAPAVPGPAAPPSDVARGAARDLLQFMFVESGAFTLAFDRSFTGTMPTIRAQITNTAMYTQLSPERRQAVDAFVETIPDMAREEFNRLLPGLMDEMSVETAGLFSESEIVEISAFMRTSVARDVMIGNILQGVERSSPGGPPREVPVSAEQRVAIDRFDASPAGHALSRNMDALLAAMGRRFETAQAPLQAVLTVRMTRGFCDALGPDCPPALRQRT